MKDLLVYLADADALAFLRSILQKPRALSTRDFSFEILRHPLRDAGMVQSGAELARMKKREYSKALLVWDHHGSGQDHKMSPTEAVTKMQEKLDLYTWSNNSAVVVLSPELEQWLWYCESALCTYLKIEDKVLTRWIKERADTLNSTPDELIARQPKELFEHIMRDKVKRTISPKDFEEIGKLSSVKSLLNCASFRELYDALGDWFPETE